MTETRLLRYLSCSVYWVERIERSARSTSFGITFRR